MSIPKGAERTRQQQAEGVHKYTRAHPNRGRAARKFWMRIFAEESFVAGRLAMIAISLSNRIRELFALDVVAAGRLLAHSAPAHGANKPNLSPVPFLVPLALPEQTRASKGQRKLDAN